MNVNDKRLGAYRKTLDEGSGEGKGARTHGESMAPQRGTSSGPRPSVALPGLVKVPGSDKASGGDGSGKGAGGRESPYRKVAKFLLLIGVDEAARVISRLTPEQTDRVVLELASIRRVEPDEATVVLAEFESLLRKAREPAGGVDTARSILAAAFGSERAEAMLEKAVPFMNGKPFDYLEEMEPDRVYRLIADELPAVKALVLSQIRPKQAARIIGLMPDEAKKDTVLRLAKLKTISPDVMQRVDATMREKVETIDTGKSDSIDGRSALAEILRRMDGKSEQSILEGLAQNDAELGHDIRNRLFTIDDIVGADDKFVQDTLRPMSDQDIAVLVAGKGDSFRQKIFACISRTRGAMVLEDEKVVEPVSRQESERVTGAFFSAMRKAWEDGKFFISGRDDGEKWVGE